MELTISELTVMQMLIQGGKAIPKNLEMAKETLRVKVNKELKNAVNAIQL